MADHVLRVIPLGGIGEIGKNATAVEYGDDIILIDCGLKFPEEEMLGIDLVIPDVSYLRDNRDRFRAIVITHGHEDHIGALPYVLGDLNVPVYGTRLTLGLISVKLKEHKLLGRADLRPITASEPFQIGVFKILPIRVTHSIPDAVMFAIDTPVGTICFTGDYKFDQTPVYGPPPDLGSLTEVGRRGVLALFSDCTRVEKEGYTPSERTITASLRNIIRELPGRVIITTFASNIIRVQQAIDIAHQFKRRVALVGRSMENNVGIAHELGYMTFPEETVMKLDDVRRFPLEEVMLITTGSQGEPSSVLSRMASNDHRQIKVIPGDTVIISATPIPGNEETVARTIDNLMRAGADVIYEPLADVHVSGHASREELKLMINLIRPKYCVPVHGEYRMMVQYRRLATEVGIPAENVILGDLGDVIEFRDGDARKGDRVKVGAVLVDGVTVGPNSDIVLRDRQHLARDGVVIVSVTLDRATGEILAGPDVIARGFNEPATAVDGQVLEEAREQVRQALVQIGTSGVEYGYIVSKIRETLSEYIYKQTRAHPMILPVVSEV